MNIAELIEALKAFPPDKMVVVDGYEGGYGEIEIVETVVYDTAQATRAFFYGRYENYDREKTGVDIPCVVLARINGDERPD